MRTDTPITAFIQGMVVRLQAPPTLFADARVPLQYPLLAATMQSKGGLQGSLSLDASSCNPLLPVLDFLASLTLLMTPAAHSPSPAGSRWTCMER